MAKNDPEITRVQLGGDPYDSTLFCPFCGEQILEPEGDGVGQCPHLIHADIGMDTAMEFLPGDFAFVLFEPGPASREHYFVFREAAGFEDDPDE
jgi:hypothetical protein